jgi:hypothetical protein
MQIAKTTRALAHHRVRATAAKFPSGLIRYFRHRNRLLNIILFPETRTLIKLLPLLIIDWIVLRTVGLFYWQLGEPLLSVDWFFITNLRAIMRQRSIFQKSRITTDEDVTSKLTLKLFSDTKFQIAGFTNAISKFYCLLTRIRVSY